MARYRVLRGSIEMDGTNYTHGKIIELEEDHAGRFPDGFLQFLPEVVDDLEPVVVKRGRR